MLSQKHFNENSKFPVKLREVPDLVQTANLREVLQIENCQFFNKDKTLKVFPRTARG